MKTIYLAGGCFWCIGDYMSSFAGILKVTVGYSGGEETSITYEEVKSQTSKHRETIKIDYDEASINLENIIDIYLSYVDPLDKEGQFIDKGYSYTLAMYYQDELEKEIYTNKIKELEKTLSSKTYIAIEPFKFFVDAEEYHQDYSIKNPDKFIEELRNSNRVCHLKKLNLK